MSKLALKKSEVRQSLALTEATYDLSRDERRIIYLAAIQCAQNGIVESGQQSFQINDYEIKVSDYSSVFNVAAHESSRDVRHAIETIFEKSVKIPDLESSTTDEKSIEEIRWIVGKKNLPKRGSWNISLNPSIVPHLTNLVNQIQYPIGDIVKLENNYQYRFYELFIGEPSGTKTIEVEWLREKFCLTDKKSYLLYSNLKNRILIPAIKQINASTKMTVDYTENKSGKKVVSWTFTYILSEE